MLIYLFQWTFGKLACDVYLGSYPQDNKNNDMRCWVGGDVFLLVFRGWSFFIKCIWSVSFLGNLETVVKTHEKAQRWLKNVAKNKLYRYCIMYGERRQLEFILARKQTNIKVLRGCIHTRITVETRWVPKGRTKKIQSLVGLSTSQKPSPISDKAAPRELIAFDYHEQKK